MGLAEEKQELARREAAASAMPPYTQEMLPTPEEATITDGFLLPEFDDSNAPPPVYGETMDTMHFSQPGFSAGAAVTGKLYHRNVGGEITDVRSSQTTVESISISARKIGDWQNCWLLFWSVKLQILMISYPPHTSLLISQLAPMESHRPP